MATFGIIGSGFGLYGYLPALCQCSHDIVLPRRYIPRFKDRKELAIYTNKIRWVLNEEAILAESEGLVLALPPILQSEYLFESISRSNILYMLLEKPLAPTPNTSIDQLCNLIKAKRKFRINYSFRYADWAYKMKIALKNTQASDTLLIEWRFLAHHYRFDLNNWKRFNSDGGSVLRFYGIHIISLLSEIGYDSVVNSMSFGVSSNEFSKWSVTLNGPGLPQCILLVDSRSSISLFRVDISSTHNSDSDRFNIQLGDPFDQMPPSTGNEDRRIPFLKDLCITLDAELEDEQEIYQLYRSTNILWQRIEDATIFVRS